jgi:hypothetical protein
MTLMLTGRDARAEQDKNRYCQKPQTAAVFCGKTEFHDSSQTNSSKGKPDVAFRVDAGADQCLPEHCCDSER